MIKLNKDELVSSKYIREIKLDRYADSKYIDVFASVEITFVNGNVKRYRDVFKAAVVQIVKEVR